MSICAFAIILGHLYVINYNDLSWSSNTGAYLGIISMTCIMIAMIVNIRDAKRKNRTK